MALPNFGFLFRGADGDDSGTRRPGGAQGRTHKNGGRLDDPHVSTGDKSLTNEETVDTQAVLSVDRQLVISVRLGDVTAFDTLVDMYYLPLVRSLTRYTGQRESAEDIVQDTFAQLWHRREELDPNRSIRAYIFKIGRNRALKTLEHDQVVQNHATRALSELGETAEESRLPGPDVEMEMADLGRLAERRVASLPPRLREAYRLSRESFLTPSEIAIVLGISVKTVHGHLAKVLEILEPVLKRWLDE